MRGDAPASGRVYSGDDRTTPERVIRAVKAWRPIELDPCWHPLAITRPRRRYCYPRQDGLALSWATRRGGVVWVNGPWSNHGPWVDKAVLEMGRAEILYWGPCYCEAAWSRQLYAHASAICLWGRREHHAVPGQPDEYRDKRGRKVRRNSMWPTQMIYLGARSEAAVESFAEHFAAYGTIMRPVAVRAA